MSFKIQKEIIYISVGDSVILSGSPKKRFTWDSLSKFSFRTLTKKSNRMKNRKRDSLEDPAGF